jgi:hypothetical protein
VWGRHISGDDLLKRSDALQRHVRINGFDFGPPSRGEREKAQAAEVAADLFNAGART